MPLAVESGPASSSQRQSTRSVTAMERPLPAELPLFCESCGYSLHALPPSRCEHCTLMHFRCPECGHRQPLTTVRPAVHKMLGRLRVAGLIAWVFFKLNFFGWLLFAWAAMGAEWCYAYNWAARRNSQGFTAVPYTARQVDLEVLLAFSLFAFAFGLFGRMLLLRWRRSLIVGAALSILVLVAIQAGVRFTIWERRLEHLNPFTMDWAIILGVTAAWIMLGCVLVWPIWVGLVRLFLPARASEVLLSRQVSAPAPHRHVECSSDEPRPTEVHPA